MNLSSVVGPADILQLVAWFLGLLQFILGLYILLLNIWHTANRHVSILFLFFAVNSFALGQLIGATDVTQAALPTCFLASTSAAVGPLLLLVSVVLLKPHWLRGRWRWAWWLVYVLAFLPLLLTLMDVGLGTRLWYTGLDATTDQGFAYAGGYVDGPQYRNGSLSLPLRVLNVYLAPVIVVIPLLYVALRAKKTTPAMPTSRRLAWLLLGGQVVAMGLQFGLRERLPGGLSTIILNAVFVFIYAYVTFRQMISERRAQRGRLQPRLVTLVLAITLPLLVVVVALVSNRAGTVIERNSEERLQATNRSLADSVSVWLDLNVGALRQLVSLPDIVSMDAARQKPVLEAMEAAYPHTVLVSTTDLTGINVARSDDQVPQGYGDQPWFRGARSGEPLTIQSLVRRAIAAPASEDELAVVASMPIRDESGAIVGVGMFASELTDIARWVEALVPDNKNKGSAEDSGQLSPAYAYVVDARDWVVAHSDPTFSAELRALRSHPPVVALRRGTRGLMSFTDEEGQRWRAYVDELDNGWGIIVQQPETELLNVQLSFLRVSTVLVVAGTLLLAALASLAIRQTFQPIGKLTNVATAIAAGDVTRLATVEGEDEFGVLACAFNSVTAQLRGHLGDLERRVAERAAELEQRAVQLQAAADVARVATSLLDLDALLDQVVNLVRERFDLYYVGLFMLDETGRWAELRAGAGLEAQLPQANVMLERGLGGGSGYRLRVGGASVVGWCTAHGQARSEAGAADVGEGVLRFGKLEKQSPQDAGGPADVGEEAVHLDPVAAGKLPPANPLLSRTRFEMALPLVARGRVIGALDVQSVREDDFTPQEVTVLQTVTDQIAVAIDNARLFARVRESLDEAQAIQRRYSHQVRAGFTASRAAVTGYRYTAGEPQGGLKAEPNAWLPAMTEAQRQNQVVVMPDGDGATTLGLPITFRDEVIGVLGFKREDEWTEDELVVVQAVADQVAMSLENVRLFDEAQRRVQHEVLVRELSDKMRRTTDMEAILEMAVQELGQALGSARTFVRLDDSQLPQVKAAAAPASAANSRPTSGDGYGKIRPRFHSHSPFRDKDDDDPIGTVSSSTKEGPS